MVSRMGEVCIALQGLRKEAGGLAETEELILLRTPEEVRAEAEKKIAGFRIIDELFARSVFKKKPELAQLVLRIITALEDLEIDPIDYETPYDVKRLAVQDH